MRIKTIVGLAVAGGAAAVAVGIGGNALAAGPEGANPAVQVTVDGGAGDAVTPGGSNGSGSGTGSATQWDCPDKDGSGGASPDATSPGAAEEATL